MTADDHEVAWLTLLAGRYVIGCRCGWEGQPVGYPDEQAAMDAHGKHVGMINVESAARTGA